VRQDERAPERPRQQACEREPVAGLLPRVDPGDHGIGHTETLRAAGGGANPRMRRTFGRRNYGFAACVARVQ
jgi:hypothetical protein